MKQLFVIVALLVGASTTLFAQQQKGVIRQEQGSITFVVDENLPAPDKLRSMRNRQNGKRVARELAVRSNVVHPDSGLIAASFMDEMMNTASDDALFNIIVKCFAQHRPLVLSPDMVWLVIAQAFSQHVNEHAEELRSRLVAHEGKMTLVVESKHDLLHCSLNNWDAIMQDFERQIGETSQGDIAKTISADFTTTGSVERIASQITLMDAMKQYYEYVVHYMACGIPNITLLGTPDDWQKVLDKARALEAYGVPAGTRWWMHDLEPILEEFVRAAKGMPNQAFWQDMVMKNTPERLRGGGCDFAAPTKLDGWILKLFPYDKDGKRTPATHPHTEPLLSEMVRVPLRYVVSYPDNNRIDVIPMELYAGIVGVKEDTATLALTPQIGWMVRIAEESDAELERLVKRASSNTETFRGLELSIYEVPEVLRKIKQLNRLELYFRDRINIPAWMEEMDIKHFRVHGKLTHEEEKALKTRFPNLIVSGTYIEDNGRVIGPPLFVVDGKRIDTLDRSTAFILGEEAMAGSEDFKEDAKEYLKLKKIRKVRILQGQAATAVWGANGIDGVVEITTK